MATWQLETQGKVTFVQFSTFCQNQETHYHDSNWPTLRITVPVKLCRVPRQRALSYSEPVISQLGVSGPLLCMEDMSPCWDCTSF